MSSISTRICEAVVIAVEPVRFQAITSVSDKRPYLIAVQYLKFALHDGSSFELGIHLKDGCNCLELGDPVEIPQIPCANGEEIK